MAHDTETSYQPKHFKQYGNSWSHCCFAGCTPMGCPGGCCVMEMGHRADCPADPFRKYTEELHDAYVAAGMRKHLAPPPPPQRLCAGGCFEPVYGSNKTCGPRGCQNRPA